ncbi:MAG TPA: apolipoprotein N-acyltransferase [Terracidiphilus sp.]|nr:apolipoprotein N-acyltransferase [Terracidiphilus sp.]
MQRTSWQCWAAAGLSAGLLELPFPLAGPLPPWRALFAWVGLAPLLWAILRTAAGPRPLRRTFLVGYLAGFLWYCGNCYWVRDTMMRYGDMPLAAPTLLLIAFSLVLGLYWGFFALILAAIRRASSGPRLALVAAPFVWATLELAAARITSVPWDQLGYSQVDNAFITHLATVTGVYGISFLLVSANALLAGAFLLDTRRVKLVSGIAGVVLFAVGFGSACLPVPASPASATAVLVQPNLDVGADNDWSGPEWNRHISQFQSLAQKNCKKYIAGTPQTGASQGEVVCPPWVTYPDMVVWPESPAPFIETEPRVQSGLASVALAAHAPVITGALGVDATPDGYRSYNSALVISADGTRLGRYDKIHLVPFGEYIPFKDLLFFAHKLTGRVSEFSRGAERRAFLVNGHRYGIFICYESVFADEVRQIAKNGAEVFVNISDDGWYGDTSAPWQHLNMARMRAIENRRWLLRDTNNGVTAAIDPYGRVRQSIPRHVVDALSAQYGFRSDVTFYTAHGDVFAWLCAILTVGFIVWAQRAGAVPATQSKDRS